MLDNSHRIKYTRDRKREPAGKTAGPGNLNTTYEKVADSLAGRLLFHVSEKFYHQGNDDRKDHHHDGEQLKITHKVTLPSTRLPAGGLCKQRVQAL